MVGVAGLLRGPEGGELPKFKRSQGYFLFCTLYSQTSFGILSGLLRDPEGASYLSLKDRKDIFYSALCILKLRLEYRVQNKKFNFVEPFKLMSG